MAKPYRTVINGDFQVTGRVIAKNLSLYDEQFVTARKFYDTIDALEQRIEQLENRVFISSRNNGDIIIGEDVLL